MQSRRFRQGSAFVLAAGAAIAIRYGTPADAYSLKGPKWATAQVPYYVNPSNADMSLTDFEATVRTAAGNWSAQTNADISFYYMGRTGATSAAYDGQNNVITRPTSNGSSAASTYYWSSNGVYVDADIVVWDGAWTFVPEAACSGDRLYLQDVLTHEFGHALGLGHSSVVEATMYPSVTWCSTALRSLASDDIAGVEKLYPSAAKTSAPTAPTGLSASAGSTAAVALAWSDNATNENGYYVERSAGGAAFALVVQLGTNVRTYTDSGLVPGTTYSYRVRAFNSGGSSAYSNTASATTPAASSTTTTGFTLSAAARKAKGSRYVDLSWRGDAASQLDVYRNGVKVVTTANDGSYTDAMGGKGAGTFSYKLCEAGTATCSNQATATF